MTTLGIMTTIAAALAISPVFGEETNNPPVKTNPPAVVKAEAAQAEKAAKPDKAKLPVPNKDTNKAIDLLSAKAAKEAEAKTNRSPVAPVASAPGFFEGVIYGSLIARRNPDVMDAQVLANMALRAWQSDQQRPTQQRMIGP